MSFMLFTQPYEEVPDEEVASVLRQSIANAGRFESPVCRSVPWVASSIIRSWA
jgi:hypothetical protein